LILHILDSTTDSSEPNDMPKSESYKDDRMEEAKSEPEGDQNGGNVNGNPNIEDETKDVEMNRSTSGVAKRPITKIATKEIIEENELNEMEMNSNDKNSDIINDTMDGIDTGDMSNVNSGTTKSDIAMNSNRGDTSTSKPPFKKPKTDDISDDTIEGDDVSDISIFFPFFPNCIVRFLISMIILILKKICLNLISDNVNN
jgi:hypothetical protein